jgi:hypothetical protein
MSAPRRAPLLLAALLGSGLLGGCALGPCGRPATAFERDLPLAVEVAAALAAGTLRAELPFADPVPQAAGAPATRLGPTTFVVRYERNAAGDWLPRATHRLTIDMPQRLEADGLRVRTNVEGGLPGFGRHATVVAELRLAGDAQHCRIEGSLPVLPGHDLAAALDRTWSLAAGPLTANQGAHDANARAFVAHRLVAAGADADPGSRRAALLQAVALGADAPELLFALGTDAASHGDRAGGADLLWQAALGTADPRLRQRAAEFAEALAGSRPNAAGLRQLARANLRSDALAEAAALLHTARREDPIPSADYRLMHEYHRRSDDPLAALACSLLQRELDATTPLAAEVDEDLVRAGLGGLVRHVATARRQALEPTATPPFAPVIAAAPR